MQILAYILARFSEPSSYAGLGAALALLGLHLSDPTLAELIQLLAAACGLLALCLKERGLIAALLLACALAPALSACGDIAAKVTSTESSGDVARASPPPANPTSSGPLSTAIWLGRRASEIDTHPKAG